MRSIALLFLLAAIDWNADLDFLQRELPKTHPSAFNKVSRQAFEGAIARLRERAASMPASAVAVEISRIVAMIGDGHTRLTLPVDPNAGFFTGHTPTPIAPHPALHFRHFPVRFFQYDEGLFVRTAARPELVGRRVLRFGSMTAEEAMAAVAPVVSADNEWGRRLAVADALAVPEVLQALGVAPELELDGMKVALEPIPFGDAVPWLPKPDPRPFFFEARDGIVHFTYNEVANGKDETLAAFVARMMPVVEKSDALVIDVRNNPGGNGSFNRALVHALIRSNRLREPGRLFVLTGRRTFSAAGFLVIDLEQNTNAIFVGEPTGAKPNGYGDSRKLTLPSSGMTVRVSSLYWQPSDPRDPRDSVAPDIAVPPARGRDAAMDEVQRIVQAMRRGGRAEGEWEGIVHVDYHRLPLRIVGGKMEIPELEMSCQLQVARCTTGDGQLATRNGDGILFGTLVWEGRDYALFARRR